MPVSFGDLCPYTCCACMHCMPSFFYYHSCCAIQLSNHTCSNSTILIKTKAHLRHVQSGLIGTWWISIGPGGKMNRPNGQQCLAKTIIDHSSLWWFIRNMYSNETALLEWTRHKAATDEERAAVWTSSPGFHWHCSKFSDAPLKMGGGHVPPKKCQRTHLDHTPQTVCRSTAHWLHCF